MQKINLPSDKIRVADLGDVTSTNYDRNEAKYGSGGCLCCAKPLANEDALPNEPGTIWLHLITNGDLVEHSLDIPDSAFDPHDQGWFQIGRCCYKRYKQIARIENLQDYINKLNE